MTPKRDLFVVVADLDAENAIKTLCHSSTTIRPASQPSFLPTAIG